MSPLLRNVASAESRSSPASPARPNRRSISAAFAPDVAACWILSLSFQRASERRAPPSAGQRALGGKQHGEVVPGLSLARAARGLHGSGEGEIDVAARPRSIAELEVRDAKVVQTAQLPGSVLDLTVDGESLRFEEKSPRQIPRDHGEVSEPGQGVCLRAAVVRSAGLRKRGLVCATRQAQLPQFAPDVAERVERASLVRQHVQLAIDRDGRLERRNRFARAPRGDQQVRKDTALTRQLALVAHPLHNRKRSLLMGQIQSYGPAPASTLIITDPIRGALSLARTLATSGVS
jgi:hypothetical protein